MLRRHGGLCGLFVCTGPARLLVHLVFERFEAVLRLILSSLKHESVYVMSWAVEMQPGWCECYSSRIVSVRNFSRDGILNAD